MSATTQFDTLIKQLHPVILGVGVISFFINLLILPMSIYSLQVMDRVLNTGSLATLGWLTLIVVIMFAAAGFLQSLRSMVLAKAADWLHDCIAEVALPQVLAQAATGGRGAQHMRDAASLKQFLGGPGLVTMLDAPWSILYIAALFVIHFELGLLVTISALLLVALAWLNEVSMRKSMGETASTQMRGLQELELATRNAEVTEAMGMSKALAARWKILQKRTSTLQASANGRAAIIQGFTKFTRLTMQILVTCLSTWLAIKGEVTSGAIIASSILASRALSPFEAAIASWKSFAESRNAFARIKTVFTARHQEDAMPLPAPLGALTVEDISLKLPAIDRPLLKNITFALQPGDLLGIIGPSGSGKSTLARLILGIWPLTSGSVRLDSADIHRWPRHDLGRYIGYLPQDVELFGGSIKDNIARFQSDATPEAIVEAAKMASAHELVLRLPQGYDTDIGPGGARLSAGQRQRIGLARAFYRNPRILLLDEPDASLDDIGQQALIFALTLAKKRNITTILITHRKSLLAHVEKILVLRDGMTEAFGPVSAVAAELNARQQPQRLEATPP